MSVENITRSICFMRIADIIGDDATEALAAVVGGLDNSYVPALPKPVSEHQLAKIIGEKEFLLLTKAMGQTKIFRPKNLDIEALKLYESKFATIEFKACKVGKGRPYGPRFKITLNDIADIIGFAATIRLVQTITKPVIFIPSTPRSLLNHKWASIIGLEKLTLLAKALGGKRIYVPANSSIGAKKSQIYGYLDKKMHPKDIASEVGCSERHVRKIIRDERIALGEIEVNENDKFLPR